MTEGRCLSSKIFMMRLGRRFNSRAFGWTAPCARYPLPQALVCSVANVLGMTEVYGRKLWHKHCWILTWLRPAVSFALSGSMVVIRRL